jgi:hypothetical protein
MHGLAVYFLLQQFGEALSKDEVNSVSLISLYVPELA